MNPAGNIKDRGISYEIEVNFVCRRKRIHGQTAGQGGEELGLWSHNPCLLPGFAAYIHVFCGTLLNLWPHFFVGVMGLLL